MSDLKWEYLRGYGRGIVTIKFFEPRWHGFALWKMQQEIPHEDRPGVFIVLPIKQGWWRPPRTWRYRKFTLGPEPPEGAEIFLAEFARQ